LTGQQYRYRLPLLPRTEKVNQLNLVSKLTEFSFRKLSFVFAWVSFCVCLGFVLCLLGFRFVFAWASFCVCRGLLFNKDLQRLFIGLTEDF